MKFKFKGRFSIWKILIWSRWLVIRETIKRWHRWLNRELPRKVWIWQLKRKLKKSDKNDKDKYIHYHIR